MHRFGRMAVAAVCATIWLATAAGVAEAGRAGSVTSGGTLSVQGASPALTCSMPLRLYDGTQFTGRSVSISERGVWVNLSTLSFDNKTSSFKVGACTVDMASAAGGGGALYPTCRNPGCQEGTMDPGWNNVISSVYLH